jgi:hypothetical protein
MGVNFNGDADTIHAGDEADYSITGNRLTLAALVRPAGGTGLSEQAIIRKSSIFYNLVQKSGKFRMEVNLATGGINGFNVSTTAAFVVDTGMTYYVVGRYDNPSITIWVDGIKEASANRGGSGIAFNTIF